MTKAAAIILALALAVSLSGCQLGKRGKPRIATPAATIVGTEGQDKPATVETAQTGFDIPANTPVVVLPDGSATFTAAAPIRVSIDTVRASTGGVSAEVANAQVKADLERDKLAQASKDRAPLLWVAIGLGVLGVLALGMLREWPIIGRGLLTAAGLAGLGWKVAEVPGWLWFTVIGVVGLVVWAYNRAERDSKGGYSD